MDFFNTITGIIITIAAALGALSAIGTFLFGFIKRWQQRKTGEEENAKVHTELIQSVKAIQEGMATSQKSNSDCNESRDKLLASLVVSIGDVKHLINTNEIDRIRWEILNFANMCRRQSRTNIDEFKHIIGLYQKYHSLLEQEGQENGQIDLEYEYISRLYMKLSESNQFTKE